MFVFSKVAGPILEALLAPTSPALLGFKCHRNTNEIHALKGVTLSLGELLLHKVEMQELGEQNTEQSPDKSSQPGLSAYTKAAPRY